jgi:hypothetical protein
MQPMSYLRRVIEDPFFSRFLFKVSDGCTSQFTDVGKHGFFNFAEPVFNITASLQALDVPTSLSMNDKYYELVTFTRIEKFSETTEKQDIDQTAVKSTSQNLSLFNNCIIAVFYLNINTNCSLYKNFEN